MVSSVGPRGAWTQEIAKEEKMPALFPVKEEGECTDATECDTKKCDTKKCDIKKEKKSRGVNPWLVHVSAFRKAHPELKYKDVLVQAKETYVKIVKTAS